MKTSNWVKLIVAVVISELAGVIGALVTTPAIQSGWYAGLVKPVFNPPSWVFGPVWTALYFLMGIALYLAWSHGWKVVHPLLAKTKKAWNPWSERFWRGDLQTANMIAIFAVQYVLNIVWSVVFFGLERPDLAFFVIITLWFSILYLIVNFYRVSKSAAWLLAPYIAWVSFALCLNIAIWGMN